MQKIRIKLVITFLMFYGIVISACDACKLQQPKITKNIAHGVGPESNWDYIIVGAVTLSAIGMFFLALKFLIVPKERNTSHIKYSILSDQNDES